MNRRAFLFVANLIALACLYSGQAQASRCVGDRPTLEQRYELYDHVFVAKFVGARVTSDASSGREVLAIDFLAVEIFKGDPNNVTITADSGINVEMSNFSAVLIGAHYVIFARGPETKFHLGMCAPFDMVLYEDQRVSQQVEVLRELAKGSSQ
jgi:hypothetical protein